MNGDYNVWPGGIVLPWYVNVGIGIGIALAVYVITLLIAWAVTRGQ